MCTHRNILSTTYLLQQAVVMTAINCTAKSERGEMICDEGEKRSFRCDSEEGFVVKVTR